MLSISMAGMANTSYHHTRMETPEPPAGCPVNHEFTPLSTEYAADPYTMTTKLREETPISSTRSNSATWW